MSKPTNEDFIQPGATPYTINRIVGQIYRCKSEQATAATLAATLLWVATFDGRIGDAFVQLSAAVAAGESMTFDLLRNGASIMTGGTPLTVNSTNGTAKAQIDLLTLIDPIKVSFVKGDVFTVSRVYAAGGGPTPMAHNSFVMEPSLGLGRQV